MPPQYKSHTDYASIDSKKEERIIIKNINTGPMLQQTSITVYLSQVYLQDSYAQKPIIICRNSS